MILILDRSVIPVLDRSTFILEKFVVIMTIAPVNVLHRILYRHKKQADKIFNEPKVDPPPFGGILSKYCLADKTQ